MTPEPISVDSGPLELFFKRWTEKKMINPRPHQIGKQPSYRFGALHRGRIRRSASSNEAI